MTPRRYFCELVANSRPIVAFATVLTYPWISLRIGSFSRERPKGFAVVAFQIIGSISGLPMMCGFRSALQFCPYASARSTHTSVSV